jgi:hypothetical protein
LAEKVAELMTVAGNDAIDKAGVIERARKIAAPRAVLGTGSVRDFLTTLLAAVANGP